MGRNSLLVAEKASVAKQLAQLLAAKSKSKVSVLPSLSKYNPIYGLHYPFANLGLDHSEEEKRQRYLKVTSVAGHINQLITDPKLKVWSRDSCRSMFTCDLKKVIMPRFKDLAQNLRTVAQDVDSVVLWLDCDREGENIAFDVVKLIRESDQTTKDLVVKRAHFSALTYSDLNHAMMNLKEPDSNFSDAAETR